MLPIGSEEAGKNDRDKLRESLTTGFPAGKLQSELGGVLSYVYFQLSEARPHLKNQLFGELEEVLQAFEKPVLCEEVLEPV